MQSANNITQFADDSGFENNIGYSFGAGFTITKYRKPDNWIQNKNSLIFGIGTGM